LSLDKAGSGYTLTVSSGLLSGGPSAGFAVRPAPATQLVFTVQPTSAVSGTAIAPPVQVTARDQFANTDTAYAGAVTVAIAANPGGGTLTGTTTVPAAAGVATFSNLSINKAGSGYTLSAAANGVTGTTSTGFTISPAAVSQLAFTVQPSSTAAGASITPAVGVSGQDAFGNTVPGFAANV